MADIIVNVQPVFDDIITQETTISSLCDVDAVFDGVDIAITVSFSGGGGGGTFDHSDLINLAFDDSGHTGFERQGAAAAALTSANNYTDSALTGHTSTFDHSNIPTSDEKQALLGTTGTPSILNKYVTNDDPRLDPSTEIIRHSDTTGRDEAGSHPASAIAVDTTLFVDTELTTSQKIAKAVDDLKASGFTKIVASDTEPTSQPINTIWINTITFNFYVLYNDGDSTQWVGFPGNTTGVSSKNYWEGTQSQYDALGTYNDNTLYFITT